MHEWQLDLVATIALTVVLLVLGYQLKKRIYWLERFCVPAAVIGGLVAVILVLILKETNVATFHFDTTLQTPAMVAFFTTIGLGGSFRIIRKGGKLLLIYLMICWVVVISQDILGVVVANLLGIDPILGVMAGGVSLAGGHGTAAALGIMTEELSIPGAATVALACATFGLIAGAILGGPIASILIKKHNVRIPKGAKKKLEVSSDEKQESVLFNSYQFIASSGLVLILMALGFLAGQMFTTHLNVVLPSYIGAMFVAILFRNLNDYFKLIKLNMRAMEIISDVTLGFFLTQAIMSLKLWELYDLALPLLLILFLQVFTLVAAIMFIVFRLLGKNYDAAVMCAGLMGHGLGAIPTGVANMTAVCEHFKAFSYKALLIVPLCGTVLTDAVGIAFHIWIINYLHL